MTFWKKLFGRKTVEGHKPDEKGSELLQVSYQAEKPIVKAGTTETPVKKAESDMLAISEEASMLISEAVKIIETQVKITPGSFHVESTGSGGIIMEAVHKLEAAHRLHTQNALVHYSYASSLHLAMQYKSADEVMKDCAQSHPEFLLAQFAMPGSPKWESMFTLPPWGRESHTVHPAISQTLMKSVLLSVRDGILPRATLFHRDAAGDFTDLQALRTARITLATVISPVRNPQVIGTYAKVYDNPSSPYDIEVLEVPFRPRGHATRCRYEYFCIQDDVDFVVIDRQDRILLNKRLPASVHMKETNHKLLDMLTSSEGSDITTNELMEALMNHQQQFLLSSVRY